MGGAQYRKFEEASLIDLRRPHPGRLKQPLLSASVKPSPLRNLFTLLSILFPMPEGKAVSQMFAGIAGRYDVANHLLSGGIDFYWSACLTRMVKARAPKDVVDLATGSGDVAFKLRDRLGSDGCRQGPRLLRADARRGTPQKDTARGLLRHRV